MSSDWHIQLDVNAGESPRQPRERHREVRIGS
jgi:hypothetical protein